jgi:DNA polymerase-3 subunit epsilon
MGWHRELLIGFDLETTGTDPREARIVTGAVIEVKDGEPIGRREWLADPGVEIPADAVAVHGISNERAAAEGSPADQVADAIAGVLTGYWKSGVPVVAYNAAFDLTLLSAELRRYGLPSLRERLGGTDPAPVVDRTRSTAPSSATAEASATSKRSARSTACRWTPPTTPRPTPSPRPGSPVR